MNGFLQDLRYALRQLGRNPGFALFPIAITALGIGATTAMFSVIHAVLLKPLAYRDPDRLVLLTKGITPVRFDEMKAASRSYSRLGTYADVMEQMTISGSGTPEVLNVARVSANFLEILGSRPVLGRSFIVDEEKPGAPAAAMISDKLWQQRFGRDQHIAGRVINLAGTPHTIIGVLPNDFKFPFAGLDVWVTKSSELLGISPQSRLISPTLKLFGRLKANVSIQQANAERGVLKQQYAAAHPGMLDGKPDVPESLLPFKDEIVSDIRPKLWMLFGSVGLALLIVCANLGSLMLARASSRAREFAVRAAIGAGGTRIIRQLLVESLLLTSFGGSIGMALAAVGVSAIRNMTLVDLPRVAEIHLDFAVMGFALVLSIVTGVLLGLAPLLVALKPNLVEFLRANAEGLSAAQSKTKLRFSPRNLLVAGQVALSLLLLIGATLLTKSLVRVYRVDPGFQSDHLLTMHIALSPARYGTAAKQAVFYEQIVEGLQSLPGVHTAAVSLTLPFTGWAGVPVQLAAEQLIKLNERPISILQLVTPAYFRTMKIAVKRGREFSPHDDLTSAPVAIINESMARRFWPEYPKGPDPIGQYLLMGHNPQPKQIVGIAADVREAGKDQDATFGLYIPNAQLPSPEATIVVRTNGDPQSLAGAIQKQILMIDPEQPVSDVKTMDEIAEASEGELRLITRLLAVFAGAATLLAVIGLYAVISYSVVQRTKELGIRQALGAQRGDIVSLVVGQGFNLCISGLVVGVCAAFGLTRVLKSLLFQVSATDPSTFIGIVFLYVIVAVLASYIPARRAAMVDPMMALRYE
jgi:putative ABC transport system permease protein